MNILGNNVHCGVLTTDQRRCLFANTASLLCDGFEIELFLRLDASLHVCTSLTMTVLFTNLWVEFLLQGLGSTESRSGGSLDLHLFPRLGVSSLSGLSGSWFKGTKSGKVDLFAIGKVLCWCVETKKETIL